MKTYLATTKIVTLLTTHASSPSTMPKVHTIISEYKTLMIMDCNHHHTIQIVKRFKNKMGKSSLLPITPLYPLLSFLDPLGVIKDLQCNCLQ